MKKRNKVPERTDKVRDETLRGENRRLRKEVSRLRKENEKLRGIFTQESEEQELEGTTSNSDLSKEPACPHCEARIEPFEIRDGYWYFVCRECGKRGAYQ